VKKILLFLFFMTLIAGSSYSQVNNSFLSIDKSDLPGSRIQNIRTFNGTSLFGYIDGGADLYLEYGFSSLWVSEIILNGGKYKTEIYEMNGPEEAFGIFSISRFRCKSRPALTPFTCQTKYQLQICSGPYYVSIINSTGSKNDSIASLRIGEAIVSKIENSSVDLSGYLPGFSKETLNNNALLVKGRLGINNGVPDLYDYFNGVTGYTMAVLKGNDKTTLSVKFNNPADLASFAEMHKWDMEKITTEPFKTDSGEVVRKLSDRHLIIEIPQ